jgi:hypothetical protein
MLRVLSKVGYFRLRENFGNLKAPKILRCHAWSCGASGGPAPSAQARATAGSAGARARGSCRPPVTGSRCSLAAARSEKGTASSKSRYGTLSQNGYGDICSLFCSRHRQRCRSLRCGTSNRGAEQRCGTSNRRGAAPPTEVRNRGAAPPTEVVRHLQMSGNRPSFLSVGEVRQLRSCLLAAGGAKKLAAPEGLPRRSPTPVLTGPCNG